MHDAGGPRKRAHQRPGAACMIQVHVREEQQIDRVGRDLQPFEGREYQRNGRVGPGVDDGRAAAGHDNVRGIHLRAHVFGVDGGDAVGECRQSWHDCIHGLRQHSSMNRKILLTIVMSGLVMSGSAFSSYAAVEERGNLVLDNIPPVDTPLTARLDDYMNSRGASFVDWLPDGGLLIATRFGDVEQLHRVVMPLGAREQLTFFSRTRDGRAIPAIGGGSGVRVPQGPGRRRIRADLLVRQRHTIGAHAHRRQRPARRSDLQPRRETPRIPRHGSRRRQLRPLHRRTR